MLRAVGRAWLALILLLVVAPAAHAQFDTVAETGPSSNRVDVFFLGDGYTASDIAAGTYANHVQNYVDYIFSGALNTDPYTRYQNFFNIYRVNVESNESGADVPQNGVYKDTALDATYQYDGETDRLLYVNSSKATTALWRATWRAGKTAEAKFITVNESIYGGGGGEWAVYAGGNSNALELALHEIGHSFNSLADEYTYGGPTVYQGSEPREINVTTDPGTAKWSHWLGYQDPTGSVVGAYEGGRYSERGIYRPTEDSKMHNLGVPYNAISREKIILDIYALVDPLDSYASNASPLVDPEALWATPVDTDVIDTQWFINGLHDASLDGLDTLDVAALGLGLGEHTIGLRAFDPTGFDPIHGWVRSGSERLEQFVDWDVLVTVPEPTALGLAWAACMGFWLSLRRRRRTPLAGLSTAGTSSSR